MKRRPTVTAAIMMSAAQRERILRAERRGKPALGCVVGSSQAENEGVGVSLGVCLWVWVWVWVEWVWVWVWEWV